MRITRFARVFIAFIIAAIVGLTIVSHKDALFPQDHASSALTAAVPKVTSPCADAPEMRMYVMAWNAQAGLIYANGGKSSTDTPESIMCRRGVRLRLVREDSTDAMQSQMISFAERYARGESNPTSGAHFIAVMGDGSAAILAGLNASLHKVSKAYTAKVIASAGYSRGEDKLMGPTAWRKDPQLSRGSLVIGVLRDGDWNIAQKWLSDNSIPNNPAEGTFNPEAMNWINVSDYIAAAEKFSGHYCAKLTNTVTHSSEEHCADGAVTWTPGDVTIAEHTNAVSIVSTADYQSQMPNVIIGNSAWMNEHRDLVKAMLRSMFDGGAAVMSDDSSLRKAGDLSAQVYHEKDGSYWHKYFHIQRHKNANGDEVELGGSSVNTLADNMHLFGLASGSPNVFGMTYQTFGDIVRAQYPSILPDFPSAAEVTDLSYIADLDAELRAAGVSQPAAALKAFAPHEQLKSVIGKKAWHVQFESGSAVIKQSSMSTLRQLLSDLSIASGATVAVHGHTDSVGSPAMNLSLSEMRAFAVSEWLQAQAPAMFPKNRISVYAHGSSQPLVPNTSAENRETNRRVEIVISSVN